MLKNLFGSQIRIDLLNRFLMHPGEEYYVRQLINELTANPRAVNRELNNLLDLGLITKRISGKQHYFSINQKHPIYDELREIFIKTVGIKDLFANQLAPFLNRIDFSFIYGSFANGNYQMNSDIDILVVGSILSRQLATVFSDISAKIGREVNYAVFPFEEVSRRFAAHDHFFTAILQKPKLFITGQENEFRRLAQEQLAQTASDQS
ncbi:nucleotidyltransferase domain-containing protein [candidate division KSB1 bacterium]|nr:nucleotidyltransferase domain-containing protein [candidate division KSB1 bacterium]